MDSSRSTLRKYLVALTLLCILSASDATPLPVEAVKQMLDRHFPPKATFAASSESSTLPAIPEIKQQLSNPDVSFQDKVRAVHMLGKMKTPGTEKFIIDFAETLRREEKKPKSIKLQSSYFLVFNALSGYEDASEAVDYADRLLRDKTVDPVVQARALYFLADLGVQEAKHWPEQYYRNSVDLDLQYAALYLGSQLRIESVIKEAINFLKHRPKSNKTYKHETHLLLASLVKTQSAETLEAIIKTIKASDANFITDKKLNAYPQMAHLYNGDDKQRKQAALSLIQGWQSNKNEIAQSLKHLISINDATPYVDLWRMHNPILTRYLLHLEYRIDMSSNPIGFKPITADYTRPIPEPDHFIESLLSSFEIGKIDESQFLTRNLAELLSQNGGMGSFNDKYELHTIGSWKTVYKELLTDGLNWSDLINESHQIDVLVSKDGLHIATIKIQLKSKNQSLPVLSANCILIDNNWYIASGMNWQ